MNKKNIIIIGIIAVVVFTALLLLFFLLRIPNETQSNGRTMNTTSDLVIPETNPATGLANSKKIPGQDFEPADLIVSEEDATYELPEFQKLINTKVLGASLDNQGSRLQYYDALEGNLLSVTFLGTEPVSLATPPGPLDEIIWSPDRKKMLFRSGGSDFQYADFDLRNPVDLGQHVKNPVFTDDGQSIIYQYTNLEKGLSNICIGRPVEKMADHRVLATMRGDVFIKRVPGQGKTAFYLQPRVDRMSAVQTVGLSSGSKEIIVNQGLATDVTFNPQGTKMIFTQLDDQGDLQLYLSDSQGKNIQKLPRTTYLEKTAWDSTGQFIYLAIPKSLPRPIDFYQKNSWTDDVIYRYDINSGAMTPIWNLSLDPNNKVVARNLFLSPEGKLLFLVNAVDQSLYVLNLAKTL